MLKSSIFKFSIWALLLLSASTTASAGEEGLEKENIGKESSEEDSLTRYDRRILRYRKHWDVLMPTQSVIQTCGNMGIISLGIGWDYGKRSQWETHLLFGIVPKYDSDEVKMTITLKENFIPWRKDWGKGWQFEPLECTLYRTRCWVTISGQSSLPSTRADIIPSLPESARIWDLANGLRIRFRTTGASA